MKTLPIILTIMLATFTVAVAQDTNNQTESKKDNSPQVERGQRGPRGPMMHQGDFGGQRGPMYRGGRGPQGPQGPMMKQSNERGPRGPMYRGGRGGPEMRGCCQCQCNQRDMRRNRNR